MKIKRTAAAGVLLRMDGKSILLDGVSREIKPYPATPPVIKAQLLATKPDGLIITHKHADHYDEAFVSKYLQMAAGPVLGPADIPFCRTETVKIGEITVLPVASRHIGKTEPMGHKSFILMGSKCVWFLGDSSPLQWKMRPELPKPDVMIVPYAYGMGAGWELCCKLAPQAVVLLHLPERNADPYGLWEAVEATAVQGTGPKLYIPDMGETIDL